MWARAPGFLPANSGRRCPMKSGSLASSPAYRSRTKEPRIPAAVLVRNAAALGVRLAARHGDRGRVRRRPCTAEQVVAGRHPKPFADPADRLAVGIALLRADPATRRREDVEVQSAKLAAQVQEKRFPTEQSSRSSNAVSLHHPAYGVISSRASGSVSNRPIAASTPSKLASDSGFATLRAQSRNLASS